MTTPSGGGVIAQDTDSVTLGTELSVSEDAVLTGVWFYSPPGAFSLPTWAGLWDSDTLESVTYKNVLNEPILSWSGPAGSGWVKATFDGSTVLHKDKRYRVAVYHGWDDTNWYSYSSGYFANGPHVSGITTYHLGYFSYFAWKAPTETFNNNYYHIEADVEPVVEQSIFVWNGSTLIPVDPMLWDGESLSTLDAFAWDGNSLG